MATGMATNFTHNHFCSNVGWHTLVTQSLQFDQSTFLVHSSRLMPNMQHFLNNYFYDNLALGYGNQYREKYGFHSAERSDYDEFVRRPKRQVKDRYCVCE